MKKENVLRAGPDDDGRRIDRIIRKLFPELPLARVYALLRNGGIRVNGKRVKQNYRVHTGDSITASEEHPGKDPVALNERTGAGKKLEGIIMETQALLVINKPRGMLVYGENSLDQLVNLYLKDAYTDSLSFKPGPLHRLDRNTSGLIVFSRNLRGAQEFSRLLKERAIGKYYLGLVEGIPEGSSPGPLTLSASLVRTEQGISRVSQGEEKGKHSVTEVYLLCSAGGRSLCLFRIRTGRTHQIRVHCASYGHPLWGDRKYGGTYLSGGYILHSYALILNENPVLGRIDARAPLPEASRVICERLFGKRGLAEAIKRAESIIEETD
ncbi:MAG TPA: RluA family pseudouridine synthase [Spirochaetia bacterium]|nr:RluA family pseudouridine synthase [Spirochaetia bacterium]